jgi:hypothetical protein
MRSSELGIGNSEVGRGNWEMVLRLRSATIKRTLSEAEGGNGWRGQVENIRISHRTTSIFDFN